MPCVARIMALLPDIRGLVGLYAGPADLIDQKTTRLKRNIAQGLSVHAEAWSVGKQEVLRIFGKLLRRCSCALPVGSRYDHQLVHVLDVPSTFAELDGQPVEQLGMRWTLAHDAEVFGRFDEAGTKDFVPHPVYGHARSQRILWTYGPPGEREPIVRLAFRNCGKEMRRV